MIALPNISQVLKYIKSTTFKQFLDDSNEQFGFGIGEINKKLNSLFGGSSLGNADILSGLGNALTGNLDYQRQLETLANQQDFSASEAVAQRKFNAAQAEIQRNFEERMANTAYQKQVIILRLC